MRWPFKARQSKAEVWTDDIVEWIDEMRQMDLRPRPMPRPRPRPSANVNARGA